MDYAPAYVVMNESGKFLAVYGQSGRYDFYSQLSLASIYGSIESALCAMKNLFGEKRLPYGWKMGVIEVTMITG